MLEIVLDGVLLLRATHGILVDAARTLAAMRSSNAEGPVPAAARRAPMTPAERSREYRKRQKTLRASREGVSPVTGNVTPAVAVRDASLRLAPAPIPSASVSASVKPEEETQPYLPFEDATRHATTVTKERTNVTAATPVTDAGPEQGGRAVLPSLDPESIRRLLVRESTTDDANTGQSIARISGSLWGENAEAWPEILATLEREGWTERDFVALAHCARAGGLKNFRTALVLQALLNRGGSSLRGALGIAKSWRLARERELRRAPPAPKVLPRPMERQAALSAVSAWKRTKASASEQRPPEGTVPQ